MAEVTRDSIESTATGLALRASPGTLPRMFEDARQRIRTEEPLPKIAGTVDVYPTELSVVFANGLKWAGRPVPQSYSVYEPELDRANREHLLGPNAPDHVLFSVAPIDDRLAALEDAGSWPVLLSHYDLTDSVGGFLSLDRKSKPLDSRFLPLSSINVKTNTLVDVPGGPQIIWAKIALRPTSAGRVAMALFKLPQIYIDLSLDDGHIVRRRFIPSMALDGFVLSPYVSNTGDFARLMTGKSLPRVRGISIVAPRVALWNESMRISFAAFSR